MKTTNHRVPAEFGPNTRFALPVGPATHNRAWHSAGSDELDRLKERLLARELARTTNLEANILLRRAATDAVALVWLLPYPLLLLPSLFAEMAQAARHTAERQSSIRERSSELLVLAE